MNENLLQRIVMPGIRDRDCRDLFFRFDTVECQAFGETYVKMEELYFNTWMNLFAAKKWFHYGALENLFLKLDVTGDFSVEIVGSRRNTVFFHIDEKLLFQEYKNNHGEVLIEIEHPSQYDAVYFILRYRKAAPCKFVSAGWYTKTPPVRENRLGVVVCTYRRENYISRTIAKFEDFMSENEALRERLHLFIVDNGQTLEAGRRNEYVDIFHNINAGGAGGFTRGLIEVCRTGENYTRCLFMDDDVEIIPESFYRTLILADYLKEVYKNATINGAMLDLYRRTFFYENLAIEDELWVHPYHAEADLLDFNEILRVNDTPDSVFQDAGAKTDAGWYYSCFPMDQEKSIDNLPLPIFIRGDDVEYGRRQFGQVFIPLNGICVWHAPFYYRVSKITSEYYLLRNMFLINALYKDDFKSAFAGLYRKQFKYNIDTYDYVSARLNIKALEDILKGSRIFEESPLDITRKLKEMAEEPYEKVPDSYELAAVKDKPFCYNKLKKLCVRLIRLCYRLLPWTKCIIKQKGMNLAQEWFPPTETFLIKKRVRVYNLLSHTSTVREFDYRQEKQLKRRFGALLSEVEERYDSLLADYRGNFKRLTSYEFWKKYLRLE